MELSGTELRWLHNALLEVLTGGGDVKASELPVRIGGTPEQLESLRARIKAALTED